MTRAEEVSRYLIYKDGWNVSQKYSRMLMNHIDSYDLCGVYESIYNQYKRELYSKKIPMNPHKKYIQVWETMKNTVSKKKNPYLVRKASVRLLHQTSVQNS